MSDTQTYISGPAPEPIPEPQPRPAFDGWLRLHRRDFAWAAERLGCTREYVRRLCLPFSDEDRAEPSGRMVRQIVRLTSGAVRPDDWHPPISDILNGRAA
ncbi:MAG: hypothetical protein ACK4Z5_03310 [Brevundimonas sp.]